MTWTTVVGFDGTVDEAQWARLWRHMMDAGFRHGVTDGFDVTPGAGAREVSVAPGTAVAPGVLGVQDAATVVTLNANATGGVRTDIIVIRANWSTNTFAVDKVTGAAGGADPALTQSEGSTWMIPVARVSVANGLSAPPAVGDITPMKPLPRVMRRYVGSSWAQQNRGATAGIFTISSVNIPDPGWPYYLTLQGHCRFNGPSGIATLTAQVGTTVLRTTRGPALELAGRSPVHMACTSDVLTGAKSAQMRVNAEGMASAESLTIYADGYFEVEQHPA